MNTTKLTRIAGSLMLVLGLSVSLGMTDVAAADNRPLAKQKMSPPKPMQLDASTPKLQESLSNHGGSGDGHQDKLGNFEIQDIASPRDPASGQATGISWSGADGDERQKPPTKGQASGSPTGQNVTGGTIPVYARGPDQGLPAPTGGEQSPPSSRGLQGGLPTGN